MFGALTGLPVKIAAVLGLLLALGAGGEALLHQHDVAVMARAQVSQDAAIQAAQAAAHRHEIAALEAQSTALQARRAEATTIKEQTHAAPQTSACATSPAVRALVDGMRKHGGANRPGASH